MYTAALMSKIKAHAVFRDVFLKAKLGDFFSWYGMKVGEAFPAEQAENGGNNSAENTGLRTLYSAGFRSEIFERGGAGLYGQGGSAPDRE